MWKALGRAGEQVPRCQVQRLMRSNGIVGAKRRGKPWRTTRPDPQAGRRPDLVQRDFKSDGANQLWVADISYLRCWQALVFFAFVLDAYSRMIVGWQLAPHMRTDLVLDALKMALGQRGPGADVELIHHSDRGSQPGLNRSSQRWFVDLIVNTNSMRQRQPRFISCPAWPKPSGGPRGLSASIHGGLRHGRVGRDTHQNSLGGSWHLSRLLEARVEPAEMPAFLARIRDACFRGRRVGAVGEAGVELDVRQLPRRGRIVSPQSTPAIRTLSVRRSRSPSARTGVRIHRLCRCGWTPAKPREAAR
jgi:hypothetical protein